MKPGADMPSSPMIAEGLPGARIRSPNVIAMSMAQSASSSSA